MRVVSSFSAHRSHRYEAPPPPGADASRLATHSLTLILAQHFIPSKALFLLFVWDTTPATAFEF